MTKKARPYYGLFIKEEGLWTYNFGDYDKYVVLYEREDIRHGVEKKVALKNMRIKEWDHCPLHTEIIQELAEMNK